MPEWRAPRARRREHGRDIVKLRLRLDRGERPRVSGPRKLWVPEASTQPRTREASSARSRGAVRLYPSESPTARRRITLRCPRRPHLSSPSEFRPLELRLAPEYRRSAVYAALGVILITATLVALRQAQLNNGRWVD